MIAHCRKFDETDFTENPHIKGGPQKAWDPVTGTNSSKSETQGTTGGHTVKSTTNQNQQAGRGQQQGHSLPYNHGSGSGSGRYPHTQGYKGNRYDVAYNDCNTRRNHRGRNSHPTGKDPTTQP
ncbi:hypothetical protein PtA15_11A40 [Puccinia triticina]|uniref:Uncharacterized protein n=1 Tax=Puccinia triticina TaxID=208348 RepID=A0ABY7CYC8_9BASI|nr:uncharacterized protein PtA15_11A40 [Puccinia triticina]WAQ89353.1 hypothetical protein PtA15_11A40 [Puccinia triticina]WAR59402.1 hypothetical protein PtB15_11B42 [Puccinia triticina]